MSRKKRQQKQARREERNMQREMRREQASRPKVDMSVNPLYPPKTESDGKGVGMALLSIVVAIVILVLIVRFFSALSPNNILDKFKHLNPVGQTTTQQTTAAQPDEQDVAGEIPTDGQDITAEIPSDESDLADAAGENAGEIDVAPTEEGAYVDPADIEVHVTDYQLDDTYDCYETYPLYASASSVKEQKSDPDPHTGDMAIDGRDETSWQEGVEGNGYNESLTLILDGEVPVKAVSLKLGNWRSEKHFVQNGRPSEMLVTIGDVQELCYFDDIQQVYWITLSDAVLTDYVNLEILDVYPGNQDWQDTCIAEVNVWTK